MIAVASETNSQICRSMDTSNKVFKSADPSLSRTDKQIVLSLSVVMERYSNLIIIEGLKVFCYTNHDQLDYLIWQASRQKYSL